MRSLARYRVLLAIAFCLLFTETLFSQTVDHPQQSPEKHGPSNRLAKETSPYLLMHAQNPVDWYPWGEEALDKARRENKVIFLSIGYSSCHWCHVMEHESFMDQEIAAFLNEHFVCIKVDREERPDIDNIYMTSLHIYNQLARTGRGGGWPLSMFLTPDHKPFFGGTYFPPRAGVRGARTGFITIIQAIQESWTDNREQIQTDAEMIAGFTRSELDGKRDGDGAEIKMEWIDRCLESLTREFDPEHGGFGYNPNNAQMPKFPEPANLQFLINVVDHEPKNEQALNMLVTTLERMSMGGIRDHIGEGFHRYSVDRFWRIPHFEKMLYDNALLLSVYCDAFRLTDRKEFRRVAEGIASFVARELTAESGGFYSALDADSEGEEGKFYRWELSEISKTLNADELSRCSSAYGLLEEPNFEERFLVPQLARPLGEIAETMGLSEEALAKALDVANEKLLRARSQRIRPLTDDKILTAWNGLMIRGLADAGRILDRPDYTAMAAKAAEFLWAHVQQQGRLTRTFTRGEARLNGYLDDYAFYINGLIALHRADGNALWLDRAVVLQEQQNLLFWDDENKGFFFTSHDHESLLARAKRPTDGAVPSGNSVAVENLVYLAKHSDKKYSELATQTVRGYSGMLEQIPNGAPRLLISARALLSDRDTP